MQPLRAWAIVRRTAVLGVDTLFASSMLKRALARPGLSAEEKQAEQDRRTRAWALGLLRTFGIEDDVEGTLPEGPFLMVANHRSAIDIGLMLAHADVAFVARADMANWPIFGYASRAVGTVFVDRSASASGAATLRELVDQLKGGKSIAIFPEGHTHEGDLVRTFQPGIALAAFMAKVPVVPVGLAYETGSPTAYVDMSFAEHVLRVAGSPGARVSMCIGAPIAPPTREERAAFTERVHCAVQLLVNRARLRVDAARYQR